MGKWFDWNEFVGNGGGGGGNYDVEIKALQDKDKEIDREIDGIKVENETFSQDIANLNDRVDKINTDTFLDLTSPQGQDVLRTLALGKEAYDKTKDIDFNDYAKLNEDNEFTGSQAIRGDIGVNGNLTVLGFTEIKNGVYNPIITAQDEPRTIANKRYVDEEIAKVQAGGVDLTNYYNKQETEAKIDEKIAAISPVDLSNVAKTNEDNTFSGVNTFNGIVKISDKSYIKIVADKTHFQSENSDVRIISANNKSVELEAGRIGIRSTSDTLPIELNSNKTNINGDLNVSEMSYLKKAHIGVNLSDTNTRKLVSVENFNYNSKNYTALKIVKHQANLLQIEANNDDSTVAIAAPAATKFTIDHLSPPTSDRQAANKKYVDDAIAGVQGGGLTLQDIYTLTTPVHKRLTLDPASNTRYQAYFDPITIGGNDFQPKTITINWAPSNTQNNESAQLVIAVGRSNGFYREYEPNYRISAIATFNWDGAENKWRLVLDVSGSPSYIDNSYVWLRWV